MIKLVLSDMDNTLLAYGRPYVSDFALDAIHRLQATGVTFAPATGRGIVELRHFFQGDEAACSCALVSSGKEVWVDGELRQRTAAHPGQLAQVVATLHDVPDACLVAYGDGEHPTLVVDLASKYLPQIEPLFPMGVRPVTQAPDYDVVACGIICGGDAAHLEAVRASLHEACPDLDFIRSVDHWCDIVPTGFTKATGVEALETMLGVRAADVVAFGDSDNDLAMLEHVGEAVAVANANDRVRAVARWHIGSAEDEAVPHALLDIATSALDGSTPAFMAG